MKKIIFLMLLIMPCFVYAEDIVIETVSIENNDNVIEVREPVINGINIDLDLKFNEVGSSITYKLGLKNKSDDDYEIEDKVISSENDNIEYTYTCEDGNRIKSRRSKTCYVKAEYKNRVTNAVLMANNLSVKEEKELNIDLIGKEIINPKTGYIDMIGLILLLIIFSVLLYYYSNNKVIKNSYIIVLAMILIVLPESYALKTVTLTINSNIEITDNTRRCSHTPRNLKEFIMCELETDLGDSLNELYQDEINNPEKYNLTNEKVNEIRSFLDTYNKSIKMLNWNNDPVTQPTEQNYRNYKEGMYINGYRSMPIFKKSSLDDYSNFTSDCIPLIESQGYQKYRECILEKNKTYTFQNDTLEDLSYNNIFKLSDDYLITNIQSKVSFEYVSSNAADFSFPSTVDITNKIDDSTVEKLDLNYDLQSIIFYEVINNENNYYSFNFKDSNNSYKEEIIMNPESISLTLFNRKCPIILNNIIDLYINTIRHSNGGGNYNDSVLEYLFSISSLINLGSTSEGKAYFKLKDNEEININNNSKIIEYLEWLKYDISSYEYWKGQMDNATTKEEKMNVEKSYFETNNIEHSCSDIYNSCSRIGNLYDYLKKSAVIVYNDKFYKGENFFLEFLSDFLHLPDDEELLSQFDSYKSYKEWQISKYIFDNYPYDGSYRAIEFERD